MSQLLVTLGRPLRRVALHIADLCVQMGMCEEKGMYAEAEVDVQGARGPPTLHM